MKPLLLVACLILASPVAAQSFDPDLFGKRFCQLRRAGISAALARDTAISETWSESRQTSYIVWEGKLVSLDVFEAANYVVNNCPQSAE